MRLILSHTFCSIKQLGETLVISTHFCRIRHHIYQTNRPIIQSPISLNTRVNASPFKSLNYRYKFLRSLSVTNQTVLHRNSHINVIMYCLRAFNLSTTYFYVFKYCSWHFVLLWVELYHNFRKKIKMDSINIQNTVAFIWYLKMVASTIRKTNDNTANKQSQNNKIELLKWRRENGWKKSKYLFILFSSGYERGWRW